MEKKDDQHKSKPIPENDPSKAMDSKKEVEQSNDEKIDQDFPGYPHYPAREDIMDGRTGTNKVNLDTEDLPSGRNATGVSQRFIKNEKSGNKKESQPRNEDSDDLGLEMGTEGDVTEDDLEVLNATNAEIGTPQNVSNEEMENDLDVPGSDLDDENEAIGEEDEENNYYSLGGDRHEAQEEDPYSGPVRDA